MQKLREVALTVSDWNTYHDRRIKWQNIYPDRKLWAHVLNDLVLSGLVLDIGCGTGEFVQYLKQHDIRARGLDISDIAIRRAGFILRDTSICKQYDFSTKLPLKDKSVSCITCLYTLEYLENPSILAQELIRVARDRIIITCKSEAKPDSLQVWRMQQEDLQELFKPHEPDIIQVNNDIYCTLDLSSSNTEPATVPDNPLITVKRKPTIHKAS